VELLRFGFDWSLGVFGGLQLLAGVVAVPLFWREVLDLEPGV